MCDIDRRIMLKFERDELRRRGCIVRSMPMAVSVFLDCPPMAINRISGGIRQTAEEPMTLRIPDLHFQLSGIIIPPTNVIRQDTRHWGVRDWLVDACEGRDADGICVVRLPPEPTWLEIYNSGRFVGKMVAQQILAAITINMSGRIWLGQVIFPRCEISWGVPMMSEAITATGSVQ
jgi:hypothetical protein